MEPFMVQQGQVLCYPEDSREVTAALPSVMSPSEVLSHPQTAEP